MACTYGILIALSAAAHATKLQSQYWDTPPRFSSIVVFGDSFSDNGNGSARVSNSSWPTDSYYNGRFSDGIVWPEYVAGNLSIPLYDYAVGGATTSNILVQGYTGAGGTIAVPSVDDQVATFLGRATPQGQVFTELETVALASPLFVSFAGANDILFSPNISASQSYQALLQAGTQLQAAYDTAKVLTISPPDLSKLPYGFYVDMIAKEQLQSFTNLLGDLLRRSRFAAVNIDLRPLFEEFEYYAAPRMYGFPPLGKYGSCLQGAYGETPNVTLCEDAATMVYWDEYHPTTQTHSWIAKQVLGVLGGPF
ncbi:GDSL-like Lipase/Acylhydrolase [Colletotrichum graminicola]|uniref:GDSL-like Lipase/Acylhydrolase n=1 Tax=Colletotrichum graminicola (strain M1.001 / M2 / FGSC 10212) TaxID=645133 RepID=E3Q9C1_COLGM|nr:GDSL-like Lipase/Acylhydrolase [Colletotrichum graminicola M1.001]EFQ27300.1 GDSL-like Lipase/Acylhydrolase [Colletotrichum graminicola M1.001]WDK13080.1 GDSL-like Lipase/Acylhydrolase [Colletotrichum graminicola]